VVGLGWSRRSAFTEGALLVTAILAIETLIRVFPTHGHEPVDQAEILEDFLRARLDALAARTRERNGCLVDHAEIDVTTRQFDGKRESRGAGADDQYFNRIILFHGSSKYV
jgi:hypothetical protein